MYSSRIKARLVRRNEESLTPDGMWVPARPLNLSMTPWWRRLCSAWGVLTGRYDALDWEDRPATQEDE